LPSAGEQQAAAATPVRCAIDTVDIARIARWLDETPGEDVAKLFSEQELADAGQGEGRAASLAARFAAKEACQKLFPRETAHGRIVASDFSIVRDAFGAPRVTLSPAAEAALGRARLRGIEVSLSHSGNAASAVALGLAAQADAPWIGRMLYRFLPVRRDIILGNLRRVFGDHLPEEEIARLAQAHYAHLARLIGEFVRFRFKTPRQRRSMVRVEGVEAFTQAWEAGRGVLVLSGHFGNFEVATAAGLAHFPEVRGRIHIVRRTIKPAWLDAWLHRRMRAAGFGTISRRDSLDDVLALIARGDAIVFPFDQHAGRRFGIDSEFFGHPAGTFKALAILALSTEAPVLPAAAWREPDGSHVLRFEPALPLITDPDPDVEIRRNTREYNRALERLVVRHPEQWWWVHRRWRPLGVRRRKR
jgi:KDO2-lipid IV(A) lauroyltransferase